MYRLLHEEDEIDGAPDFCNKFRNERMVRDGYPKSCSYCKPRVNSEIQSSVPSTATMTPVANGSMEGWFRMDVLSIVTFVKSPLCLLPLRAEESKKQLSLFKEVRARVFPRM